MTTRGIPSKENPLLGIFELDQAKALNSIGHEVVLLSMDFRSIRRRRPLGYNSYKIEGVSIEELSLPIGNLPRNLLIGIGEYGIKKLMKLASDKYGLPELLHSHFIINTCIMSRIVNNDIPFVVTEHSSEINSELTKSQLLQYKAAYSKADALISVSCSLKNRIKELFDVDSQCIHNIVDVNSFTRKSFDTRVIKKNVFTFITVAGLSFNKRIDLVIGAIKKLNDDGFNTELIIVGDGSEKKNLDNLTATLKIKKKVRFAGKISRNEIGEIMKEADCFVLPSRSETFGVSFIEAMASGLPVIATRCGGPEDFVNKKNGLLIPVDDLDALVLAMKKMIINNLSYNRKEISEYAVNTFSPTSIAKQIEKIYYTFVN